MKKLKLVSSGHFLFSLSISLLLPLTLTEMGTLRQRLGTDSQLPFGYCALSMQPAEEPVVSPSGHIYSRECILEYLLTKSRELKQLQRDFEAQKARLEQEVLLEERKVQEREVQSFLELNEGTGRTSSNKRSNTEAFPHETPCSDYETRRKKIIDDTDHDDKMEHLRKVSPWVPQFTPQARATLLEEPPKRPPSPNTGRPLRTKDLIPIHLERDPGTTSSSHFVRYLCPVSR